MTETIERKSKWGKVAKVGVIFATIFACIAGIAYSLTDIGEAAGSYEKHRTAAIRAKLPFTAKDMNELTYVAPAENCGQKALSAVLEIKNFTKQLDKTSTTDTEILAVWKSLLPSFEELEKGSRAKYFVFPRNYQSYLNDTPEYTPLHKWGRLIDARCTIAVKTGERDLAHRLILFLSRIAILVQRNLDLDPIHMRGAYAKFAEKQILTILNTRGKDKTWRDTADEALAILDKPYNPIPMIGFYHFRALRLMDGYMERPNGIDPGPYSITRAARFIPRFERANLSRIHDYFSRCILEYPRDPYDFAVITKHLSLLSDQSWGDNVSYIVAGFTSMGFQNLGKSMALETAKRNVLMQASYILEHGIGQGKGLPIKGRDARDIDGNPLRLKKVNLGWLVYSIGPDGIDDGGDCSGKAPKDFGVLVRK